MQQGVEGIISDTSWLKHLLTIVVFLCVVSVVLLKWLNLASNIVLLFRKVKGFLAKHLPSKVSTKQEMTSMVNCLEESSKFLDKEKKKKEEAANRIVRYAKGKTGEEYDLRYKLWFDAEYAEVQLETMGKAVDTIISEAKRDTYCSRHVRKIFITMTKDIDKAKRVLAENEKKIAGDEGKKLSADESIIQKTAKRMLESVKLSKEWLSVSENSADDLEKISSTEPDDDILKSRLCKDMFSQKVGRITSVNEHNNPLDIELIKRLFAEDEDDY